MHIKITLTTKSPLISASGESSAHIDTDVKYDKYGFPYIQARTFKGLLRESAMEVCEIFDYAKAEIDKKMELFGNPGKEATGKLQFNNLYLQDYETITKEINQNPTALRPDFVKNYYTEYRKQTTIENEIEEKKGTAKDTSLRNYRLIKAETTFETVIENVEDVAFMEKVLVNLRYMGSRRNRGFGKILVKTQGEASFNSVEIAPQNTGTGNIQRLCFRLKTLDTLLISKLIGDQNTVHTEHFIPAQNIRGLVAGLLISQEKNRSLSEVETPVKDFKAHKNNTFQQLILDGKVKYGNAFLAETMPVPKVYGYEKIKDTTHEKSPAFNLFASENKGKTLKGISGFIKTEKQILEKQEVSTSFSFHSVRHKDRLAGRSTEEDGGIFYYEAIEKGQIFEGEIWGSAENLKAIQTLLLQNKGQHRMGKSKTAQYSKVQFERLDICDLNPIEFISAPLNEPMYLVFQSPVITYNDCGIAIPDICVLKKELEKLSGCNAGSVEIEAVSSLTQTESYMGVWYSKTPREAAFDIGTTLKITFSTEIAADILQKVEIQGLGERKNEGFGNVKWVDLADKLERNEGKKDEGIGNKEKKSFTHKKLAEILAAQDKGEKIDELKKDAVTDATQTLSYKNIPNSLISRLKDELKGKDKTVEQWRDDFVKKLEGKKAHTTLHNAHLWDKLISTTESKDYWLTFFKALRTKNNQR